jgi:alpha-tubulin suppressor-like RCC1 family protein
MTWWETMGSRKMGRMRLARSACFVLTASWIAGCELFNDLDYLRGPPVDATNDASAEADGGRADANTFFDGPDPAHLNGIVQIAMTRNSTTCARRADDKLFCWGGASVGELGIPPNAAPEVEPDAGLRFSSKPLELTLSDPVKLVRGGGQFFCAVDKTEQFLCWGYNSFCALGRGTCTISAELPAGVAWDGGAFLADDMGFGPYHGCAHLTGGSTVCWGSNTFLQAGVPSDSGAPLPSPTKTSTDVSSIVAGEAYTCGLKASGNAQCWGNNDNGTLGAPIPDGGSQTATPVEAAPSVKFLSLAGGWQHVCGVDTSNQVWCWGKPDRGATGNLFNETPHKVPTFPRPVKQLATGEAFTCGLLDDGRVACMGTNDAGQLGIGGTDTADHATPTVIPTLTGVSSLVAGSRRACAISGGYVHCWGSNALGGLGDGTRTDRTSPTKVVAP